MTNVTRRGLLKSTVAGALIASASNQPVCGDDGNRLPSSMGKSTRTNNGFDGIRLQVIAADDFLPVSGVFVSLTCIGNSISETRTSGHETDENGMVVFDLKHEIAGPYVVDLFPPKESRFCHTSFQTPEHMLTIREDGRYLPQVFRVMFKVDDTNWQEMTGLGRRGDCDQRPH